MTRRTTLWIAYLLVSVFSVHADWQFDWNSRTDVYGKPAGILASTPFPIDETISSYSILNDEHPSGIVFMLGTIYFVDNAPGCINGNTHYNPTTRSCGSGTYTVYTSIKSATTANPSGNKTLLVREGTYIETPPISIPTGLSDNQRYNIIGYRQERPIIDGNDTNQTIFLNASSPNIYATFQRLKVQNSRQEGFLFGNGTGTTGYYVSVIDVEIYNCCSGNNHSAIWNGSSHSDVDDGLLYSYGAHNTWIYHVTAHHSYGHGIKMGDNTSDSIIEWSIAYECGWWPGISETTYFGHHSMGFDFPNSGSDRGRNNIVRYSIAHDVLFYPFYARNNVNISVHHNEFYYPMRGCDIMPNTNVDVYQHSESYSVAEFHGESQFSGDFFSNIVRGAGGVPADGKVSLFILYGPGFSDDTLIYNNMFYDERNLVKEAIWISGNTGSSGMVHVYNNSFYIKNSYTILDNQRIGPVQIKNNIFYQAGTGSCVTGSGVHDYNLYYFPGGSRGVSLNNHERDANPNWMALPQGIHTSDDFRIVDLMAGSNMSTYFWKDFNNTIRSNWDIGAYEFESSGATVPAKPEGLRIKP